MPKKKTCEALTIAQHNFQAVSYSKGWQAEAVHVLLVIPFPFKPSFISCLFSPADFLLRQLRGDRKWPCSNGTSVRAPTCFCILW